MGFKSFCKKVNQYYFDPFWFEKGNHIYKALGVGLFRYAPLHLFGRGRLRDRKEGKSVRTSNYFIGTSVSKEAIKKFENWTYYNEKVHLYGVLMGLLPIMPAIDAFAQKDYGTGAFYSFGLVLNSYCVMLQRYNRVKIHELREKRAAIHAKIRAQNLEEKLVA